LAKTGHYLKRYKKKWESWQIKNNKRDNERENEIKVAKCSYKIEDRK
jgi:hypothetical protein